MIQPTGLIKEVLCHNYRKTIPTPSIEQLWETVDAYAKETGWSLAFLVHLSATTYALSFQYLATNVRGRKTVWYENLQLIHRQRTVVFRTNRPMPEIRTNGNIVKYYRPIPLPAIDDVIRVIAMQAKTNKDIWVAKQLTDSIHVSNEHFKQRQIELNTARKTEAKQQKEAVREEKRAKKEAQRIKAYEKRKANVLEHWHNRTSDFYKDKRAQERARRTFQNTAKDMREKIEERYQYRKQREIHRRIEEDIHAQRTKERLIELAELKQKHEQEHMHMQTIAKHLFAGRNTYADLPNS